jgi:hypothetical protein
MNGALAAGPCSGIAFGHFGLIFRQLDERLPGK